MANDIRSNVENIYQIVQNFSNQLGDYSRNMANECKSLSMAIVALAEGWQAGDYHKFADSINSKIASITKELESSNQLKEYLDNVSSELKVYLDKLRQAGE